MIIVLVTFSVILLTCMSPTLDRLGGHRITVITKCVVFLALMEESLSMVNLCVGVCVVCMCVCTCGVCARMHVCVVCVVCTCGEVLKIVQV